MDFKGLKKAVALDRTKNAPYYTCNISMSQKWEDKSYEVKATFYETKERENPIEKEFTGLTFEQQDAKVDELLELVKVPPLLIINQNFAD